MTGDDSRFDGEAGEVKEVGEIPGLFHRQRRG